MVNLGWSAIPPEALGGLDFGCKGLGAVFEQIGSKLGAAPLLSSIVLGGSVLELAGSRAAVRMAAGPDRRRAAHRPGAWMSSPATTRPAPPWRPAARARAGC
jgi:alkylation response protein AidB-like acyl-CoA dehydrogenase